MDRRKDKCNDIGIEPEVYICFPPIACVGFYTQLASSDGRFGTAPLRFAYVFEGYLMNPIRRGGCELFRP